jgi:hypothetical protein
LGTPVGAVEGVGLETRPEMENTGNAGARYEMLWDCLFLRCQMRKGLIS